MGQARPDTAQEVEERSRRGARPSPHGGVRVGEGKGVVLCDRLAARLAELQQYLPTLKTYRLEALLPFHLEGLAIDQLIFDIEDSDRLTAGAGGRGGGAGEQESQTETHEEANHKHWINVAVRRKTHEWNCYKIRKYW